MSMTTSWIKSRLTWSYVKELPLWLGEEERHSSANPNCWLLIFHFTFFSLTCRKKEAGQWKALIVRAACSSLWENSGLGGGGVACSLYSSESSLSLQAVQPDCQDFIPAIPTCLTLTATAELFLCRKTGVFFLFFNLREVFEDLQMELRMEIWCCWCGWQHMNGWMDGWLVDVWEQSYVNHSGSRCTTYHVTTVSLST